MREEKGMTLFALCLYGIVLFPKIRGHVDVKVVKMFPQIQSGINPALPILAETFRSLSFCRNQDKGRFVGCTPLLYIWLLSHLNCPSEFEIPKIRFSSPWMTTRNPIAEFGRAAWSRDLPERADWARFFVELEPKDVVWRAPWMSVSSLTYRCGGFHYVPLLGPWGCTGYSPLLVLKQMCMKQFVPTLLGLEHSEHDYEQEAAGQAIKLMREAWKDVRKIKEGHTSDATTKSYEDWRFKQGSQRMTKATDSSSNQHSFKRENQILLKDKERIQREMNEWKQRAMEAESDLEKAKEQLRRQSRLEKENSELDRENRRLNKMNGRFKVANATLTAAVKDRDALIEKLDGDIQTLHHSVSELGTTLESQAQQMTESETNNEALRKVIKGLQFRLQKYEEAAEKIMAENRRLEEAYHHEAADRENFIRDNEILSYRCQMMRGQIENALERLRMMARRAGMFADWGAELRASITPLQVNGERLSKFFGVLCRDLEFFSCFF